MADEHAPDEQIAEDQNQSEEESSTGPRAQMSRRQFLVGAGTGLVVGAAGATGVLAIVRPSPAPAPAPVITAAAAPQPLPVASNLPPSMRRVTLNINGKEHEVVTDVRQSLWEVMTYDLGMSGANLGCDRAQCGACTVMIDDRPVNSCAVLAARLGKGQKIMTVEALNKGTRPEDLHPIQRAFWQESGLQCGLCTRGMIMSTYSLLTKNPSPNEDDVREALAGNICRCSEYPKIYESVFRAADDMRKKA